MMVPVARQLLQHGGAIGISRPTSHEKSLVRLHVRIGNHLHAEERVGRGP